MLTRYLYGAFSASANSLAFIEVVKACRLRCIQITIAADMETDADAYAVEVSGVPYFQGTTNDAQGIYAIVRARTTLVTSGLAADPNSVVIPTDIAIPAGSRIYLNGSLSGTDSVQVSVVLHCT